jgi:dethiobiotin synthetase
LITAALSRFCLNAGVKIAVISPVEINVKDPAQHGSAASLLKWASKSDKAADEICLYRFEADLDPDQAASQTKSKIDFSFLVQTIQRTIDENDFTLIDGSGGLMVPLAGGLLMADLIRMVDLPLIVVNCPSRDSVNHTLMTLFTARQMDLTIAGYLINKMPEEKNLTDEKLPHSLAVMTVDELLGILPLFSGNEKEIICQLAEEIGTLKTLAFLKPFLPASMGKATRSR